MKYLLRIIILLIIVLLFKLGYLYVEELPGDKHKDSKKNPSKKTGEKNI